MLENLRSKSEAYRHKVAFFTAAALSLVIFAGWAGSKGFIGLPNGELAYNETENTASVASADSVEADTPFDNSMSAFKAAFGQFDEQYQNLKETLSNVFVPFISGIEVYESK